MALIDPRRIGAVLFLLASQSAAQKPADLTAVLTQIEGQVTLSPESRAEFRSVRRAARRQIISRGEIVHVPTGAQVSLICSTEALVSLTGPRDWALDATACGRGVPLPESSYRNLTSYAGRILPRNGALLLEMETRNVDVGAGPILLSPRDTAVLEASPRLVWSRAPDAVEYEIEIRGPVGTSIRLAADSLQCGHGSGPWRDLDVCSWTPSGKWPALEPEKPVFLKLGSRQGSTAPLRQVREAYEIHLLSVGDQRNLQEALRQIATLPVDKASLFLLTAGTYARRGLYADAIANYDEALQAQEIPEARVTLGDLYLTVGLTALADREYRQVLTAPASAAQAAAELGLGQVAYARKLFDDARAHFERASDLYTKLGLLVEAEEARAAAASLQVHRGNDGLPYVPAPGSLPHGFCMQSLLPAPCADERRRFGAGLSGGKNHEETSRLVAYAFASGNGPSGRTTWSRAAAAARTAPREPRPSAAAARAAERRAAGSGALRRRAGERHAARQP